MNKVFLEVFNEGLSPNEMNAVRGGAADTSCKCNNGAQYDCGCYSDCDCNGEGTSLICSRDNCSCNNVDSTKPGGPATGV